MPPLLCPSPLMLDHAFPRSQLELSRVASALGELELVVRSGDAAIAITGALRDFLEVFDWEHDGRCGSVLSEIYRFCSLLFLYEGPRVVSLAVDSVDVTEPIPPHPAPADATDGVFVDYWREELGVVFRLHQAVCKPGSTPFIAVACTSQFAGEPSPGYETSEVEHFELVGPKHLSSLGDALTWDIPAGTADQTVSFSDAYRNLAILGCCGIDKPSGGSHYKARFEGKRPWVLDPNTDPIPDRFLGELEEITGLPSRAVKFALKTGRLPPRRLRLE